MAWSDLIWYMVTRCTTSCDNCGGWNCGFPSCCAWRLFLARHFFVFVDHTVCAPEILIASGQASLLEKCFQRNRSRLDHRPLVTKSCKALQGSISWLQDFFFPWRVEANTGLCQTAIRCRQMRQVDYAQAKREWQMKLLGCGKLLKQTLMGSSRPNRKSWRVETPQQQGSWRACTSLWSWVPKLHIVETVERMPCWKSWPQNYVMLNLC